MDERRKARIDRLAELANVGAGHAAGAFGQLVGETIRTEVPLLIEADPGSRGGSGRPPSDEGFAGVFFEFEGCLDAIVAILFPRPSSERLVRRILGIEHDPLELPLIESALMEVGNILASHVASAIADTLRERLLPSIPSLAMEAAEETFARWIEEKLGPEALRIESRFHDDRFELEGRLVLVPTRDL
jgi:chemotaxis protein CheY-P-specific phosphatase CheC